MQSIPAWLPSLMIGVTFTGIGCAKVYGRRHGILGGRGATIGAKAGWE